MALHDFLPWLRREPNLYCDGPQCGRIINTNHVACDMKHGGIYHIGDCTTIAFNTRAFDPESPEILTMDYILRKEAIILFLQGKLKQR